MAYSVVLGPLSPTHEGNDKRVIRRVRSPGRRMARSTRPGHPGAVRQSGLAHGPDLGLAFRRVVRGAGGILPSLLEIAGVEDVLVDLEAFDPIHAVVLVDVG